MPKRVNKLTKRQEITAVKKFIQSNKFRYLKYKFFPIKKDIKYRIIGVYQSIFSNDPAYALIEDSNGAIYKQFSPGYAMIKISVNYVELNKTIMALEHQLELPFGKWRHISDFSSSKANYS